MQKGEKKKRAILDTAERMFFQKGYEETTVQEILDALKCSKGSFYHHFDSKIEVLAEIAAEHTAASRRLYSAVPRKDPTEAFNRLLYHAGLLRKSELNLLRSLRALQRSQDGILLLDSLQEAAIREFQGDFLQVLYKLKQQDLASFSGEAALVIAFRSFLTGCSLIFQDTTGFKGDESVRQGMLLLRALRGQTDAALGLRAGSTVIVEASELADILMDLQGL